MVRSFRQHPRDEPLIDENDADDDNQIYDAISRHGKSKTNSLITSNGIRF